MPALDDPGQQALRESGMVWVNGPSTDPRPSCGRGPKHVGLDPDRRRWTHVEAL